MMLAGKTTIVYGGGGVIGGAIARAFADEGAVVHLAGRTRSKVEAVADDIAEAGGPGAVGSVAEVDVLDEGAVTDHAAGVAAEAGGVDVVVNAVGFVHVQGTPLEELSGEDFSPRSPRTHGPGSTSPRRRRRTLPPGVGASCSR
jgi:3-oxoacyl-[acyl-carrier protein] reductase